MVNNLIKLVIVLLLVVLGYKYFIDDSNEAINNISTVTYNYYECRDINSVVTTVFATDKELEDAISIEEVNIVYKDGVEINDPNKITTFDINSECYYVTRLEIPIETT